MHDMFNWNRGHFLRWKNTANINRLLLIFPTLLIVFFLILSSHAAAKDGGVRPVVHVGGGWDLPPYEFINQDGQPDGYNVELVRAIAEVMGLSVEFKLGHWPEMREKLQTGEIDLLQGMFYTPERALVNDFSNPHSNVNHAIFARKGMPTLKSLNDLRGKDVIVPRGSLMHDFLVRQGKANQLILTDTPADALRLLASGSHDYAGVGLLAGIYLSRESKLSNVVPVNQSVVSYQNCFAVKKGNARLLSKVNEGLAILKKTGQFQEINKKWFGVLDSQPIRWQEIGKYVLIAVVPLLFILLGTIVWSRTLKKQVAQRTEALTLALHELQINQKQLVQADKMVALGTLVSGVAHEINNPNGLILLSLPTLAKAHYDTAEILEEYYEQHGDFQIAGLPYSRMKQEIPRIFDEVQDSAQRIKRIVLELKDFSRRDDNADKGLIDLNKSLTVAVRLAEASIKKATRCFNITYGENLPEIYGNAQRIEQVIINLILNACQALPDCDKKVYLKTCIQEKTGRVMMQLKDEGIGIAPEHLPQLTDPFFTTKRESGGTGLGLSVSDSIVKDHGALLTFESIPGKGTIVTLSFPAAQKES